MNIKTRIFLYALLASVLLATLVVAHPASDVSPCTMDESTAPPTCTVVGDGQINVADVVILLRAAVNLTQLVHHVPSEAGFKAGDVTPASIDTSTVPETAESIGNGRVDIADVVLLLRSAVGLTTISHPPIVWEPASLEVPGIPGQQASVQVRATIRSDLPALTAWLTPSLSDYLTVEPASFGPQAAGTEVTLTIRSTLPPGSTIGDRGGTLHLRDGNRTVARPIPLRLTAWPRFIDPATGFIIYQPPGSQDAPVSLGQPGFLTGLTIHVTDGVTVSVLTYDNPGTLDLTAWYVSTLADREYSVSDAATRVMTLTTVGGREALEVRSTVMDSSKIRTFIACGTSIVGVRTGVLVDTLIPDVYFLMLQTFTCP
jgi:hypothetical protein